MDSSSGGMVFIIILYVALIAFIIASYWKIYTKAGKPGWACLIPIYSTLVMLEIIRKPWWWLLMFFIPLVNIYYAVWYTNMLSKAFGKSEGFTVGLLLLPVVFIPILAFGDAQYQYGDDDGQNAEAIDAGVV